MEIKIYNDAVELGSVAADFCADLLNQAIATQGYARLLLSTGASQIDTLKALVNTKVDWGRVEAFHLDEYIGIPASHPASFQRYLQEKFVNLVPLRKMHFVETSGDIQESIGRLSRELRTLPIDVALIGIGENTHIAFNDPPADFDTEEAYIIVELDEDCKKQQVGEGWFKTITDVPKQAVTMSVHQIMQSKAIVSCVPYRVKASAVKKMLDNEVSPDIPATILKTSPNFTLFLDKDSASLID